MLFIFLLVFIFIFTIILFYIYHKYNYIVTEKFHNKKIACITSIYGNYDNLKTPNIKNMDKVDWFCFTDNDKLNNNVWKIITKKYHLINNNNILHKQYKNNYDNITDARVYNMMCAKYYKIKTHEIDILQDYDYYIWIDGSIILQDDFIINIMKLIDEETNLINFKHSCRDNIRDEVILSLQMKKYDNQNLEIQYNDYINSGFTDDIGLYENTVIIKKNTPDINNLFNNWWIHNLEYSYQDQISYPYVLWKANIIPNIINENVFNNKDYTYSDFSLMSNH